MPRRRSIRFRQDAHPCLPSLGEWPVMIEHDRDSSPELVCNAWTDGGYRGHAQPCLAWITGDTWGALRRSLVEHVTTARHVATPAPWSWY